MTLVVEFREGEKVGREWGERGNREMGVARVHALVMVVVILSLFLLLQQQQTLGENCP